MDKTQSRPVYFPFFDNYLCLRKPVCLYNRHGIKRGYIDFKNILLIITLFYNIDDDDILDLYNIDDDITESYTDVKNNYKTKYILFRNINFCNTVKDKSHSDIVISGENSYVFVKINVCNKVPNDWKKIRCVNRVKLYLGTISKHYLCGEFFVYSSFPQTINDRVRDELYGREFEDDEHKKLK